MVLNGTMIDGLNATAARVLNRLVERRPEALPAVSLVVHDGFSLNGIRSACRDLERRGLVLIEAKRSGFDDVRPTQFYRAAEHAVLVEVPKRGQSPGRPAEDGPESARGRVMAAVRQLGQPATLREVCATCGLGETATAKVLKAAMADGLVTRVQGPPPRTGSVRPWLWRCSDVSSN